MDTSNSAVLFDIDGTLVDSTYHHAVSWHRAFARLDLAPPPLWRIHRTIGMGGDKLVSELAGEVVEHEHGADLRDSWRVEYLALRAEVGALPGASDVVRRLRAHDFRVALASSGDPQFAREAVALLGIGDHIEALLTSEDVDASKPEPDLVGETLRRLSGVRRAVFVGDTIYDVEAARRAGIRCIGLRSGGYGTSELERAGAALVNDGPSDLMDLDWSPYLSTL